MNGVVHHRAAQFLAVLAVCTSLLVGVQGEAKADYQFGSAASTGKQHGGPDSNGYVPEYYGLTDTCYDQILGRDRFYYDYEVSYGPLVHYIYYDSCEMKRLGATSAGWSRLYAHERAHSRGFAHYEGTPSYNASYYPKVDVT